MVPCKRLIHRYFCDGCKRVQRVAKIISLDRIDDDAKVGAVLLAPWVVVQSVHAEVACSPVLREGRDIMKIMTNGKWLPVVAVALLCFAPSALAQTQLELTGVNGNNYDGIFIGPYDIQVGGPSGQTYGMICDDFNDDIGVGSTWKANPVSVSASTLSQTLFGYQSGALQGYEEVAALSYAILFGNQGATNNALMQYAIWAIFSPTQVESYLVQTLGSVNGAATWSTIQGLIAWASKNGSQSLLSEFIVWTPANCKSGSCGGQEFLQFVPEGGAAWMYLLLGGITCFGAMFYSRRQQAKRFLA